MKQWMHLHVALAEVAHACKSLFLGLEGNQSTQLHMQEAVRLLEGNAHFWLEARLTT